MRCEEPSASAIGQTTSQTREVAHPSIEYYFSEANLPLTPPPDRATLFSNGC
jgi:hypothetical protein